MKRNKKIVIIIFAALGVLVCAGSVLYIWYINSPFTTVKKLMRAVEEKNTDAIIDCIEPETAQKLRLLMSLTGISADDIVGRAGLGGGTKEAPAAAGGSSVKFSGYSRDGERACITLLIVNDDGEESRREIQFVRISGTWYLSLGINRN